MTSLQYLFETPLPGHEAHGRARGGRRPALRRLPTTSRYYDGMHVVLRPDKMPANEMQRLVVDEYRKFYSRWRIVSDRARGDLRRFRRLSEAQRAVLSGMRSLDRFKRWLWFHIEYKYAPVTFTALGYARVRQMLRDPSYEAYLSRLQDL